MGRLFRFNNFSAGGLVPVILMIAIAIGISGCNGKTCTTNWSGYWWPMKNNGGCNLFSPGGTAAKYDKYVTAITDSNPGWLAWEKQNHDGPNAEGWWGHCHALASASILEKEPGEKIKKSGITFSILDQKGMLVECHYDDPTAFIVSANRATRFHSNLIDAMGKPEEKEKIPVVMDKNPGRQVWNYVIVDYSMKYKSSTTDSDRTDVTATITYLGYGPCDDSYTGCEKNKVTYTYWIEGDFEDPSYGEWTGSSVTDHPHFFWYPDYRKKEPGCPIDYQMVKKIMEE